jgi:hypothetical protein
MNAGRCLSNARVTAIVSALLAAIGACGLYCPERIVTSLPSPNGLRTAEVFVRRCGATASGTHVIRVEPVDGRRHTDGGIVLAVRDRVPWRGSSAEEERRHYEIQRVGLRWIAHDSLEVSVDSRATVTTQRPFPDGVAVVLAYRHHGPSS